ncbi:MAG: trypsin-like peptidase domain-containing protein [Lachnospiraceae bacterium]|nr:trypsin-like peptidase domain-containing protein [Lachnospiraceae bacterium]
MGNRKKKPSVFKNILIVTGCTMFAALYAMAALYLFVGIPLTAYTDDMASAEEIEEAFGAENDSLPAWVGRVEIELEPSEALEKIESEAEAETRIEPHTAEEEETQAPAEEDGETGEPEESAAAAVRVGNVRTVQQADTAKAVVTDVTEVVKAAMPCVVAITNEYTAYDYWFGEEYEDEASASGIIISQNDEELLILTNYHVVEDSNSLSVKFIDNTEAAAYIKGAAADEDLAVISVFLEDISEDTAGEIALAALGDSDGLEVGEPAIAIGNSLGYGQSVTTGVISALNCSIFDSDEDISAGSLIQTDAAINPGNSGGALLNINGEVIGINSSKIADYAIEGMGYAIPINTARPIVDELVTKETKRKADADKRAFLGVSGTDVSPEAAEQYGMPEGVYVSDVLEDTAAADVGIQKGDIITALDGEKIASMTRLQAALEYYEAGSEAEITFERIQDGSYKEKTVKVTLGLKQD